MAFTRVAALLHAALSDVTAAQHHAATVAGDLNLADLNARAHGDLSDAPPNAHHAELTFASQAEMETATALDRIVSPGRTHNHPGVAKVWCKWEQAGAHGILASYNMTSVTDGTAVGDTDHVIATDFSSIEWVSVFGCNVTEFITNMARDAGTLTTLTQTHDGTAVDSNHNMFAGFGDQ